MRRKRTWLRRKVQRCYRLDSCIRILVALVICIVVLVSCKILEPEIYNLYLIISHKLAALNNQIYSDAQTDTVRTKGYEQDRRQIVIESLIQQYRVDYNHTVKGSPWDIAETWVKSRSIHPSNATFLLGGVLRALQTATIKKADVGYRGTQLKLSLILEGGQRAAFKPQWYSREKTFDMPYAGADRHNGEIAAFHLNRLLELNRVPIVVGRRINLRREIMLVAEPQLLKTFYISGGNTCFYGQCYYCKGKADGVCADRDILEGAVILWLPHLFPLDLHHHPWARTYRRGITAQWEKDTSYCDYARTLVSPHTLLDLIETAVFDYLIGNADRHHYERFAGSSDSVVLLLDNGKSFSNPKQDEHSILAPLYQCCKMRSTLWKRLLLLQEGILGAALRGILENEPISPVVTEAHLDAMDRRLTHVMDEVDRCFSMNTVSRVLVDR